MLKGKVESIMRFAAIALTTGLVGILFAASLQGTPSSMAEAAPLTPQDGARRGDIDEIETGSIAASGSTANAIRLIDLRSGMTCKTGSTTPSGVTFTDVPLSRDCKTSPSLGRIAQWRSTEDGSLIMADRNGATILEFVPGDGVLYESIYPTDQLITIVPARG